MVYFLNNFARYLKEQYLLIRNKHEKSSIFSCYRIGRRSILQ